VEKITRTVEIKNKLGVHARAAAQVVQTANKFSAQITLSKDGQTANARSILEVLTLGGAQGSSIQLEAVGDDAEQAVRAIERLVDRRFNEPE
jgi:phosphotransferase system HPr (HPr) family protein